MGQTMQSISGRKIHAIGVNELDIKTVDSLLYGWGEWRLKKKDANGYAPKTITGLLMDGAIGFGRGVMKSMIPIGIVFESEGRAELYRLIDGYCDDLDAKPKAVLIAYYSVITKDICTDQERAVKLGLSEATLKRIRVTVRDGAKNYLQSRILIA